MNPLAHWMYNINTREAKLFNDESEYSLEEWTDTPAKCNEIAEADSTDRDALKAEAIKLGLEFPSNIKTAKLIEMITVAKSE